jgi:hypothetical protein
VGSDSLVDDQFSGRPKDLELTAIGNIQHTSEMVASSSSSSSSSNSAVIEDAVVATVGEDMSSATTTRSSRLIDTLLVRAKPGPPLQPRQVAFTLSSVDGNPLTEDSSL